MAANVGGAKHFAAALDARALVRGVNGGARLNEVALAVNSRAARTQDQLHIHIGCLPANVRRAVQSSAAALAVGEWERIHALASGRELWAWRTGQSDLGGVEPFRLAAATLPDMNSDRSTLMIAVAGVRIGDEDELVVLAASGGTRGAVRSLVRRNRRSDLRTKRRRGVWKIALASLPWLGGRSSGQLHAHRGSGGVRPVGRGAFQRTPRPPSQAAVVVAS